MKFVFAALLFCLTCVAPPAFADSAGAVAIGAPLREAHLQGLQVPNKKLSSYRGKPLLINVWASWCAPCRAEMGSLERLARRYGGKQLNVIGVSTDDYIDRATLFLQQTDTSFHNFIDSQLYLETMLGANRLPLTLLVDAKGRLIARFYGARDWDSPQSLALIGKNLRIKL